MTSNLTSKTFLITGSSGIAEATARLAGAAGARLFIAAIDPVQVERLTGELRGEGVIIDGHVGDLSEEAVVAEAVRRCLELYGRIDGLFNVVGMSGRRYGDGPVHESTAAGWQMTLRHNLDPTWLMCRAVAGAMLRQPPDAAGGRGAILNMTSVLAAAPEADHFATHAYAAAKGAISSLTLAMASYYAPHQIRVNAIAPGLVRTPMSLRAQANPEIIELMKRKQPLHEDLIEAADIARPALFLLSDEARSITGEIMTIDAGWRVS
ncbi:MAG: SDR family NAD(P)-dependent oxidoreductase [Acidobacteriota bacterium]